MNFLSNIFCTSLLFTILTLPAKAEEPLIAHCPNPNDISTIYFQYWKKNYRLQAYNKEGVLFTSRIYDHTAGHRQLQIFRLLEDKSYYEPQTQKLNCTYLAVEKFTTTVTLFNKNPISWE